MKPPLINDADAAKAKKRCQSTGDRLGRAILRDVRSVASPKAIDADDAVPDERHRLLARIEDLIVEREMWAQELFETNRLAESLTVLRQQQVEQLDHVMRELDSERARSAQLAAERDALVGQTQLIEGHLLSTRQLLVERTEGGESLAREVEALRRRERSLQSQLELGARNGRDEAPRSK